MSTLINDATPAPVTELTAADRCDACGAQGYMRVTLPTGELVFCAHHGRKHADALADVATHIHDETSRLHEED